MQIFLRPIKLFSITIFSIAMSTGIAMPVFAESAPVYDADSMQQQFDNAGDQGQDLPPPPPPNQEGTFVPVSQQQQVSGTPTAPMSMEQRMKRVEQQINNIQGSDSSARVDSLQGQIQALRSQIEQLSHQLQQMQNQQKSLYSTLDKRLSQQKNTPNANVNPADIASVTSDGSNTSSTKANRKTKLTKQNSANATAATDDTDTATTTDNSATNNNSVNNNVVANTSSTDSSDGPNVAEEQQIYQTAYNLIKAKKYNDAVNALQKMLQKYPSGQFASNAHYWLGELYGLMGENDQALTEFSVVVKTYPDSPRVSDAQLKIALIYAAQSKWSEAKSNFRKVINHYPGTASARLASEQLKQIKQAGH